MTKLSKEEVDAVMDRVVDPRTQTLKDDYQKVCDFYINSTPNQRMFLIELIKNNLTFFNTETREMFDIDEEYQFCFNGPFIQIPIK